MQSIYLIDMYMNNEIFNGFCFSALEALINFVYSGRVHLDRNNVQSIMMGASFLQLVKVKEACATFLLKRYIFPCFKGNISFFYTSSFINTEKWVLVD